MSWCVTQIRAVAQNSHICNWHPKIAAKISGAARWAAPSRAATDLAVPTARNFLVKVKFHYASWFEACRRKVRSQILLRYLVRTSFEPAPNQHRTCSEPTSVVEFGFYWLSNIANYIFRTRPVNTGVLF